MNHLTPDVYERMNALGETLRAKLRAVFDELEVPAQVTGIASLFGIHFTDEEIRGLSLDSDRRQRYDEGAVYRLAERGDTDSDGRRWGAEHADDGCGGGCAGGWSAEGCGAGAVIDLTSIDRMGRMLGVRWDMKITRYSKDVDILMVNVSEEPIAYAEEAERFIVHFSKEGKLVLLEILDAKDFVMESLECMLTATMGEGVVYVVDKEGCERFNR